MIDNNTLKCPYCDTGDYLIAIPSPLCTYIRCMRRDKDGKIKCGKEFVIPNADPEQLKEDTIRTSLEEKKKKLQEKLKAGPQVLQKAKEEQIQKVQGGGLLEMIEEHVKKNQAMQEEYDRTGNCMYCKKEKATTQSSIGSAKLCQACKDKEDKEVVPILKELKKDPGFVQLQIPCDCGHTDEKESEKT